MTGGLIVAPISFTATWMGDLVCDACGEIALEACSDYEPTQASACTHALERHGLRVPMVVKIDSAHPECAAGAHRNCVLTFTLGRLD